MPAAGIDADTRKRLERTAEVRIETRRTPDAPVHRTTIWVVVTGYLFIRSYKGRQGRWYREVLANPEATLIAGRTRIPVRAVPVTRSEVNAQVDEAYRRKYGSRWPDETAAMLRSHVRRTTLRLAPRPR